jgi:hypothetical protein
MTLTDFMAKWNGKYIDFDGVYGNQCMDLAHQYYVEVLGVSDGMILSADCAKNVYLNFNNMYGHEMFEKIANTDINIPEEGDIMIWESGTWGHIAIFVEGDVNSFRSFDQNYPTGSPCHIQNHTYSGMLGWLRYKGDGTLQAELDKCRLERDRNWNWFTAVCDALGVGANVDQAVAEAKKLVALEDSYNQKDKQLQDAQAQVADLQAKASQLSIDLSGMQDQLNVKQAENEALQQTVNDKVLEVSALQKSIQELTAQITTPVYKGWKAALIKLIQKL